LPLWLPLPLDHWHILKLWHFCFSKRPSSECAILLFLLWTRSHGFLRCSCNLPTPCFFFTFLSPPFYPLLVANRVRKSLHSASQSPRLPRVLSSLRKQHGSCKGVPRQLCGPAHKTLAQGNKLWSSVPCRSSAAGSLLWDLQSHHHSPWLPPAGFSVYNTWPFFSVDFSAGI
jgi:hypothetical protein